MVRKLFVSSAVSLIVEFHVDGLRVDQTTSMHSYNRRHADGSQVGVANELGAKLLRELTRTLRMVSPNVMLIAEDHSDWAAVTEETELGGLGFDVTWYAAYYHHLIGDADNRGPSDARLIKGAGFGDDRALAMDYFASALSWSESNTVVYHESHDEAGNDPGTDRTIAVAVNGAPLVGETRRYAEARCRFAFGITMLSAGTPMFFMGEEVGSDRKLIYNNAAGGKVDFAGGRTGSGARLFAYYRDMITFRLAHPSLRNRSIDILSTDRDLRLIAFLRWHGREALFVVATLSNRPLENLTLDVPRLRDQRWREVFNSDAPLYGGDGVGNFGLTLSPQDSRLTLTVPANGIVVLHRIEA